MKKILWIAMLCLFFLGFSFVSRDAEIVLYREGESCAASSAQWEELLLSGWYEEPVCRIYNEANEEKLIFDSDYPMYQKSGWAKEPYVSVYLADGTEKRIVTSDVPLYIADGWLEERPDWEGLSALKNELVAYLSGKGNWGVFVQNLENNEYLVIREERYSAASLIKLFTMASVYEQMRQGNLENNAHTQRLLHEMIAYSSNEATNALTILSGGGSESKGYDNDNAIAQALGCTNTGRGSYLVEESGRKGPYRHHNYTSPWDCGRLLKAIYKETLISPEASREMLSLLLSQTRTWKIPAVLPEEVRVANKTGETNAANHDVAIVFSPGADYILCVLGNGGVGTIHGISERVYQYFNHE